MNTGSYNCIIIDDDKIDRLTTLSFARKCPLLTITGVFASATDAFKFAEKANIDVLLSDIDMPEISGLDFRRKMMDIPVCIFITSYADFAVESFELSALDFLIKPLKADRFDKTMARAKEYLEAKQKAALYEHSLGADTIFIKDGHNFIKVRLHEILYLEALKDYTLVVTSQKKHCVLSPISGLLQEKNFRTFIRVHRSYAVQKHLINEITTSGIKINDMVIPIGRTYKESLGAIRI